jgi:hypothetical protein
MYRPDSLLTKRRIDYSKTWYRLAQLFKNPASIRPDALPEHLAAVVQPTYKFKLPRLKGNVYQTMKEIIAIFMADWQRATRPIHVAIRTTRTSLAKRCSNADPKTAYRHILTLIEHGFLRAKVQVKGGLQLLINPDVLVFDGATAVGAPAPQAAPKVAPAASQAPLGPTTTGLASLLALAAKISQPTASAFLKNCSRA